MVSNQKYIISRFISLFVVVVTGFVVFSCANRASGPTGGPKDTIPPVILKTTPLNKTLNFRKKQIEIYFDENIQIEKATENIVVSPPQSKDPEVKGNGKVLTFEFLSDLVDSTTYTINFGNAIVDLNEKNPLKNYSFSFSTGDKIDTLKISGKVISAENLNPVKGMLVGIYQDADDSVFFKKPFLRIAKTDENGNFSIENVKPGKYKVYALGDVNRDYFYQPGEDVAFIDSMVTPLAVVQHKNDTVWKDSITVDTVKSVVYTGFYPNNLLFKSFKESSRRQYITKYERKQEQFFSLFFNSKQNALPEIKPLNFEWNGQYLLQKNATLDSLTYWLKDSMLVQQDTLILAVNYMKSDSLNNLVLSADTLNLIMRRPKITGKAKVTADMKAKEMSAKFATNLASSFDLYNPIIFKFESPTSSFDINKIHLYQKIDSIQKVLPVNFQKSDSVQMTFHLTYKWEPEKEYELLVDSAAFTDIYGKTSKKLSSQFKIKSLDEYSSINIKIEPFQPGAIVQVLDAKDQVVAQKESTSKGCKIEYLKPGDYYLRMFLDENGNGKWDPGAVVNKKNPEVVYYYPKKLSLMANWEFEETWNVNEKPLLEQKPRELYEKTQKK